MTTAYIVDTGVFVRCGGPGREKFERFRRAVRGAGITLLVPRRVYGELGGDPGADVYPSANIPYAAAFDDGWIEVGEELDYSNSLVSTVMDEARRFIATETNRDEDAVETTDAALIGLAAQQLQTDSVDQVLLLTTDKPAGRAAEALLSDRGFGDCIEYRYASESYLDNLSAADFR